MASLGTMPLINDYSLCRQTVTVYRYADGTVTRTVHRHAYFERKLTGSLSRTGDSEQGTFLLVIPGSKQVVGVGDKVFDGIGPTIPATEQTQWWRSFIPSKVDGLVVVRSVALRRWDGRVTHTEASG